MARNLIGDPSTDTETFDDFFRRSWPGAYRLAAFLTGDPAQGEEVAQEALAALYRTWQRSDNPDAYLRATIVNRSRNVHRNRYRQRAKLPLLAGVDRVEFAADELSDAVARLPFRQRSVIVLRYYLDLSETEIADALGCRPGTVKSLSSRALARLSREITR